MKKTRLVEIELDGESEITSFLRSLERSLAVIEETLGVTAGIRGNKVFVRGDDRSAGTAEKLIRDMITLNAEGRAIEPDDLRNMTKTLREGGAEGSLQDALLDAIPVSSKRRFVVPKTETQRKYINTIRNFDVVIGIGPAGTGKTYLAMAMAMHALMKKQVSRIVLARPAIEAGEKLGYLPGDMYEKVNPYLRPLYDALFDLMEAEKATKLIERGIIEIAPLAFMRGRTLNDSFIILDEAQNTTSEQMKMYLTRLGFSSKTVITGDITQIDLPSGRTSGLVEAMNVLKNVKGISFIFFTEKDVVRHKLVQEIVKAYEKHEKRTSEGQG